MPFILFFIAAIELIGGIGVFSTARSAIHEILGTLAIGFSFLTFGLAAILVDIRKVNKAREMSEIRDDIAAIRRYYEPADPFEPRI
jgi:hypothetical protein